MHGPMNVKLKLTRKYDVYARTQIKNVKLERAVVTQRDIVSYLYSSPAFFVSFFSFVRLFSSLVCHETVNQVTSEFFS
jgi:hypothetical protein